MGFYDSKLKIDSGLIDNMGGTGKAFAYLGKSLSDVSEEERKKKKDNQDEAWRQKLYQDSRTDRSEDVLFRNNNADREQNNFDAKMNFTKEEANREQKNFDTKFNFQKEKVNQAENKENDSNVSKAKVMRKLLEEKYGIDTRGYSDKDLIYAGDIIEKRHTDETDYKISQFIYNDKEPFAVYKNAKGNIKLQSLFGDSSEDPNETEAKKQIDKRYGFGTKEWEKAMFSFDEKDPDFQKHLKSKYGSTSTINID